jgi:mannan endo-1,4-beta-mannosidase
VLGTDSKSELIAAANWWKSNYAALAANGSFTINLMNEWGSHRVSAATVASYYNEAIAIVRQVYSGYIIIDAPGWGQEAQTLAAAAQLITDPLIVLSLHIYPSAWNQVKNRWVNTSDIDDLASAGRPCIIGEFGNEGRGSCDWSAVVDYAKSKGWTILGWCWNGDGGSMNMVTPSWADNPTATEFSLSSYFPVVYDKL